MAEKEAKKNTEATLTKSIAPQELGLAKENKVESSVESFSQYIRSLLQNTRQGTVSCKTRSEVSLSGKKPWKQKGTGRARAGTARSPLWRSGGVTFGPQPRTRKLSVPSQVKRKVLGGILWNKLEQNQILSLEFEQEKTPKTAKAYKALQKIGLENKKINLFINPEDIYTQISFRNLPNVRLLYFSQPNAYSLADAEYWLVLSKDIDKLKEMVELWT